VRCLLLESIVFHFLKRVNWSEKVNPIVFGITNGCG
jgi:hypothetical protein